MGGGDASGTARTVSDASVAVGVHVLEQGEPLARARVRYEVSELLLQLRRQFGHLSLRGNARVGEVYLELPAVKVIGLGAHLARYPAAVLARHAPRLGRAVLRQALLQRDESAAGLEFLSGSGPPALD